MAGFDIEAFKSKVNEVGGLYRPNRYEVRITFPAGKHNISSMEKLTFMANSANLPGAQILSSDHRRQNYGTFDRRAFGIQVTDIPITFFIDQNGEVLNFFNRWLNQIVNYNYKGGEHSTNQHTSARLFEVGYQEDYVSTINITAFKDTGNQMMEYTLLEAFPIQMGDVTVAWSETDSFAVLPVQFTFRSYSTTRSAPSAIEHKMTAFRDPTQRFVARDGDVLNLLNTGSLASVPRSQREP